MSPLCQAHRVSRAAREHHSIKWLLVSPIATVHLCSTFILHFDTLFLLKWVACQPSEPFLNLTGEFIKADLELV
jgi:hypothetical protein